MRVKEESEKAGLKLNIHYASFLEAFVPSQNRTGFIGFKRL